MNDKIRQAAEAGKQIQFRNNAGKWINSDSAALALIQLEKFPHAQFRIARKRTC